MKALAKTLLLIAIVAIPFASCKKKEKAQEQPRPTQLVELVHSLNESPDRELANGLVLTSCQFKETDTVLTYNITVPDKRFENQPVDSIKVLMLQDFKDEGKGKILRMLKKYRLGVRYVCSLPDGTKDTVEISRREVFDM